MKVKIKRLLLKIGFIKSYYVGSKLLKNPPTIKFKNDDSFVITNCTFIPNSNSIIKNCTFIKTFEL